MASKPIVQRSNRALRRLSDSSSDGSTAQEHDADAHAQAYGLPSTEPQSIAPRSRQRSGSPEFDPEVSRFVIPSELCDNEAPTVHAVSSHQLHRRYHEFLRHLCQATATMDLEPHCARIWCQMIERADCPQLDLSTSYETKPDVDVFAYAFVIYTWQVVGLKRFHGTFPQRGEYLHRRWASYFLSACRLLQSTIKCRYSYLVFAAIYWENKSFHVSPDRAWVSEPWLDQVQKMSEDEPCYRNDLADQYLVTWNQEGIPGLVRLLLKHEVEDELTKFKKVPEDEEERDELFKGLVLILVSIDEGLLKAIIQGQVTRQAQNVNSPVSNVLEHMKTHQDQPPAIYLNSICDTEGVSPTPCQWLVVCDLMERYVRPGHESDVLATKIDEAVHPPERASTPDPKRMKHTHRYNEGKGWLHCEHDENGDDRRKNIFKFVREMRNRLQEECAKGREHTPLTAPVAEVGFSNDVLKRLKRHRHHRGSNCIMNLAQAAFEYRFPDLFHLHQHVIYHCWRETQPWGSEILLTRLAQGYIYNAGGFNHQGAEDSNSSAFQSRSVKEWAIFEEDITSDPGFARRLQEVKHRSIAEREAKIERLKEIESTRLLTANVRAFSGLLKASTKAIIAASKVE